MENVVKIVTVVIAVQVVARAQDDLDPARFEVASVRVIREKFDQD